MLLHNQFAASDHTQPQQDKTDSPVQAQQVARAKQIPLSNQEKAEGKSETGIKTNVNINKNERPLSLAPTSLEGLVKLQESDRKHHFPPKKQTERVQPRPVSPCFYPAS